VVKVSEAEYDRLTGERPSLKDFHLSGPDLTDLDLDRYQTPMREVTWYEF
jgi:hypothetical protein